MSVRAKMDGGKQINRVQSGSFEHRCMAAGLSLTLGPTWAVDTWKHLFTTPSPIAEMYANQRKRKHEQDTARKATETYKHARLQKKYNLQPAITDKDYGPEATAPNLTTQSELRDICKEFLKSLQVTEIHVAELAKSTADKDPAPNSLWQRLRSVWLTASKFSTIIKRQSKFEKLVETIHYKPPPGAVAALDCGRSHEDTARKAYTNGNTSRETYHVDRTGIHICTEHPWLAAYPDGLVEDPSEMEGKNQGILEIKCPYSARTLTPESSLSEAQQIL